MYPYITISLAFHRRFYNIRASRYFSNCKDIGYVIDARIHPYRSVKYLADAYCVQYWNAKFFVIGCYLPTNTQK